MCRYGLEMSRFWVFMKLLLVLLVVFLLVGCGGKTVKYYDDPSNPDLVTRIETDTSFWASENYLAYLEAEERDRAAHERMAAKAIADLVASFNATEFATPTEKVLASIILRQDIRDVSTYRGTGRAPPHTMVDQNWPAWGQLFTQWGLIALGGGIDYERNDSPGNTIKGDRNIFIYKSDLGTGAGSRGQFYLGDYAPIDAASTGHASSLSLDASRPYEYNYDASRQTIQTWTDSPTEKDGGLF